MKIRKLTNTYGFPSKVSSSNPVKQELLSLVINTKDKLKVSSLVHDILHEMSSSSKDKIQFLDAYDSGNIGKASAICSKFSQNKDAKKEVIVNLLYKCFREILDYPAPEVKINMSKRGSAIPAPIKTRVKNELHSITSKKWSYIPLDKIFWTLRKNGLLPLQEDGTQWEGMLMGAAGCGEKAAEDQRAHFPLAFFNEENQWVMTNASVMLTWCLFREQPKTFEIVVYMG